MRIFPDTAKKSTPF